MFQTKKPNQLTKPELDTLYSYVSRFFTSAKIMIDFSIERNNSVIIEKNDNGHTTGFSFYSLENIKIGDVIRPGAFLGATLVSPDSHPIKMFNLIKQLKKSVLDSSDENFRVVWGRTADPFIIEYVARIFEQCWPKPPDLSSSSALREALVAHSGWELDENRPFLQAGNAKHRFNDDHISILKKSRCKSKYAPYFDEKFFQVEEGDRVIFHAVARVSAELIS